MVTTTKNAMKECVVIVLYQLRNGGTCCRLYDTSSHASEVQIDTSSDGGEGCGGIGGGGCVYQRVRGGGACLVLVNCILYMISSYYTRLQVAYLSLCV